MSYEEDETWWADKWADEADEDDRDCEGYRDWREDFHSDEAVGFVDYWEDGPFLD